MTERGSPAKAGNRTVTIYDVAKQAGVSITTVSHTLNRPNKVRPETRARVWATIEALDFVPKASAISNARRGVGRIGVLAPFTSYASYSTRLFGVMEQCADEGIDIVVFDHASVAEAESPLLRALPTTGRLDGLIIMGVPLDNDTGERLARSRLAVVLVDSEHTLLPSVNVDDDYGGYTAGRHLVERGHRSFAFIAEPQRSLEYYSPRQRRLGGFHRALAEVGLDADATAIVDTSNDLDGGRRAAARVAALSERVTAIFVHQDDLAAGVIGGLRAAALEVPDDVAVVGYDGGALAEALDLTTVVQPFLDTGRQAASLLLAQLSGTAPTISQVTIRPRLRVGSTT